MDPLTPDEPPPRDGLNARQASVVHVVGPSEHSAPNHPTSPSGSVCFPPDADLAFQQGILGFATTRQARHDVRPNRVPLVRTTRSPPVALHVVVRGRVRAAPPPRRWANHPGQPASIGGRGASCPPPARLMDSAGASPKDLFPSGPRAGRSRPRPGCSHSLGRAVCASRFRCAPGKSTVPPRRRRGRCPQRRTIFHGARKTNKARTARATHQQSGRGA